MADDFQFNFRGFYPTRGFKSPRMPEDVDPLMFNNPDSFLARDIRDYMDVAATGRQPDVLRFLDDAQKERAMVNYNRGMDRSPAPAPQQVANGFQLNAAQQQPANMLPTGTAQQVGDLKAEYAQNEKRIVAIRQEIAQLEKGALTEDQLDMALAANRADIGDIGNSILHQNKIANRKSAAETRAWNTEQAALNRKSTKDYTDSQKREDLEYRRNQLKVALTYAKDAKTQDELNNQIAEVDAKLAKLGGVEFNWKNEEKALTESEAFQKAVSEAVSKAVNEAVGRQYRTGEDGKWLSDDADSFAANFQNKEGYWKSEEAKKRYNEMAPERDAADVQKKKANLEKKTVQEVEEKKRQEQAKVDTAIKEVMDKFSNEDIDYLLTKAKSDSTSKKASNGQIVTISRAGDGLEFKIGKTKKTR